MARIDFTGKTAIVTGAGRGLGRAYALELARRGANVVVNDPGVAMDGSLDSAGAAAAVVAEIVAKGGNGLADQNSVATEEGAYALVDGARSRFGGPHIVINNAGILRDRTFRKKDMADFRAVLGVHLWGTVYVTRAAWPHLMEQRYGRVLVTTSGSGLLGNFGQADYGAAKMGVLGLMSTLAIEGARHNVHVNAIKPAAATRMAGGILPEDVLARLAPNLVMPAALYLVSENAPNGSIIQASGGWFSRVFMAQNPGVDFGPSASVEAVAGAWDQIHDDTSLMPLAHQEGTGQ